MKKIIGIYLAGSIKKCNEKDNETFWTEADMEQIRRTLSNFEVHFLNPAFRKDNLSDGCSVFGRDMLQVFSANFVFVDARDRRGLGVGAEMMWAKVNGIPVVTWAPRNSHYHKDQTTILDVSVEKYVHPFVESLSDRVVETVEDGAIWMEKTFLSSTTAIKGIQHISFCIDHYRNSQLQHDSPMQEIFQASEELQKRSERPRPQLVTI